MPLEYVQSRTIFVSSKKKQLVSYYLEETKVNSLSGNKIFKKEISKLYFW